MKKKLSVLLVLLSFSAFSQDLSGGLNAATAQVNNIKAPLIALTNALMVIIALTGIVRVFVKYQNGENDTQKAAMTWGAAFLFVLAARFIVNSAF